MDGTIQTAGPTREQWGAYQRAWSWFNDRLFAGSLEPCILNFSRRSRQTRGFFAPDRWRKDEARTPEISLNPDLLDRPLAGVMSTLVHEMVHQWQFQCGRPSRGNYHNREWAGKMKEVGLHPSNTGRPGGKQTGQRVTHYIVEDGPFDRAFRDLPEEYRMPWTSGSKAMPKAPPTPSKVRFTCRGCGAHAWGRPGLEVVCGACELAMPAG